MNNILNQIKGAGKMLLLLNIILALFNFSVLKDNRHVSFLMLGDGCQAMAAPSETLDAMEAFK